MNNNNTNNGANNGANNTMHGPNEQAFAGFFLGEMLDAETNAANVAKAKDKTEADKAAKAAALAKSEEPPKLGQRAKRAEHRGKIHKRFPVKRMSNLNPEAAKALKNVRIQKYIAPQPARKDKPKREAKEQAAEQIKMDIKNPFGLHCINEDHKGNMCAGDCFHERMLLHVSGSTPFQCEGKQIYTRGDDKELLYLLLEFGMDKKDVEKLKILANTLDKMHGVSVVGFNVNADSLRITNGDAVQARAARATPATLEHTTPMENINALQTMRADGPELLLAIEMKGLGDQKEVQQADGSVSIMTFVPEKSPTNLDGVSALLVPLQGSAAPGKKQKMCYQLILTVNNNKPGLVLSTDNPIFLAEATAPERMQGSKITLPDESSDGESSDSESDNEAGKKVAGNKRKEKYETDSSWESSSGQSAIIDFSSEDEALEYNSDDGETLSAQQMEKAIANAKKLLENIEECYHQPSALPQRGQLVRLLRESTQLAQIKLLLKPKVVLGTLDACAKKTNAKQTEPTRRCPAHVALWYNEMKNAKQTKKGTQQKNETQRKTKRLGEIHSKKPRLNFGDK